MWRKGVGSCFHPFKIWDISPSHATVLQEKINTICSWNIYLLQPTSKSGEWFDKSPYFNVAKWRFGNKPQNKMSSVLDNGFFLKKFNSFNVEYLPWTSNMLTRSEMGAPRIWQDVALVIKRLSVYKRYKPCV